MVSEADKKRKRVTFLKSTTYLSAITPSVDSVGCHPYLPRVDCSTHTGKSWTGGSRIFCIAHPVQNDDFYCSYSPPRVHLICTPLPCSCHPKGNWFLPQPFYWAYNWWKTEGAPTEEESDHKNPKNSSRGWVPLQGVQKPELRGSSLGTWQPWKPG